MKTQSRAANIFRIALPGIVLFVAAVLAAVLIVFFFPRLSVDRWALIVATVTFVAVLIQIVIARQELDAVNEDLALANRRADLYATTTVPINIDVGLGGSQFQLNLRVHNKGKRMNSEARMSLAVPDGWGLARFPVEQVSVTPDAFNDPLRPNGYHAFSCTLRGPFFPQDKVDFNSMVFRHPNAGLPIPEPIYYRIIFEDGAYPDFGQPYDVLGATDLPL